MFDNILTFSFILAIGENLKKKFSSLAVLDVVIQKLEDQAATRIKHLDIRKELENMVLKILKYFFFLYSMHYIYYFYI